MVKVLSLVTELTSTSIPVEISGEIYSETDTEMLIAPFYEQLDDEVDPDVKELDIPTCSLGGQSRFDPGAYHRLRSICRKEDVDILHTHHNAIGSLGRLAVAGTGTKIVNTEHNDHAFFSKLQKAVNSATFPLIDVFVSNSVSTQNSLGWYEDILASRCRHEVVYNGIDISRIEAADSSSIDLPDGPILVTASWLSAQKNHVALLRSLPLVFDDAPEATLVIVGDGPLSEDLDTLASRLGIQDSVVFTGYLPRREDVYGVYKKSDIAVFPSWYEGFCVAAVEAMATGLPVVVSDIEVFREVVGDSGTYIDPADPSDLAKAILDLLDNPGKRARIGEHGKERVRGRFPLERTVREYYHIYESLAEDIDK